MTAPVYDDAAREAARDEALERAYPAAEAAEMCACGHRRDAHSERKHHCCVDGDARGHGRCPCHAFDPRGAQPIGAALAPLAVAFGPASVTALVAVAHAGFYGALDHPLSQAEAATVAGARRQVADFRASLLAQFERMDEAAADAERRLAERFDPALRDYVLANARRGARNIDTLGGRIQLRARKDRLVIVARRPLPSDSPGARDQAWDLLVQWCHANAPEALVYHDEAEIRTTPLKEWVERTGEVPPGCAWEVHTRGEDDVVSITVPKKVKGDEA